MYRRAVFEQLSQKVGALYPVTGFVRRNRSGNDGQKQQWNRGESHFCVTGEGAPSLQAGPGTVHFVLPATTTDCQSCGPYLD